MERRQYDNRCMDHARFWLPCPVWWIGMESQHCDEKEVVPKLIRLNGDALGLNGYALYIFIFKHHASPDMIPACKASQDRRTGNDSSHHCQRDRAAQNLLRRAGP